MPAYATVAQLREYLRTLPTTTSTPNASAAAVTAQDAVLQSVLDRAASVIDAVLTFSFGSYPATASDEIVKAPRGQWLLLPPHQPGSITAYTDCITGPGAGLAVPLADVVLRGTTKIHAYLHRGWLGPFVKVNAKWGAGPAPASIVEVNLELAVNIWRSATRGLFSDAIGVDPVGNNIGGGAVAYSQQLTRHMRATLEAERAARIGVAI